MNRKSPRRPPIKTQPALLQTHSVVVGQLPLPQLPTRNTEQGKHQPTLQGCGKYDKQVCSEY